MNFVVDVRMLFIKIFDFEQEVTQTLIFSTIGVILLITAIGIVIVNKKSKEVEKKDDAL
jgi:hypothetical protein